MSWHRNKQGPALAAWRNNPAYKRARVAVLARAGHRCELQLPGCTHTATQAHHMDGVTAANLADTSRMQATCAPCNQQVGDPRRHDPTPRPRTTW